MTEQSDTYYINKVLSGDKGAYSYLVNRYSDMVYSIAVKLLKNESNAEDLSQDVFVSAYQSLTSYKGNAKFSTWLYRITYNKAISELRKKNYVLATDNEVFLEKQGGIDTSNHYYSQEENVERCLGKAITQLTENDQIIITLYYYKDQSVEDISTILGISSANVKIKLFRIRKKLKELLDEVGNEMLVVFD